MKSNYKINIKFGWFSKGNTVNVYDINDLNTVTGTKPSSLSPSTVVANHLFLENKLVVGTKNGSMNIYLGSKIFDIQKKTAEDILIVLYKNNVLAPLNK